MPSDVSPRWRDKASGFFSTSGVRLRMAGQTAGSFMGEVAKDAGGVAEKVGCMAKNRWAVIQEARQQRPAAPPRDTIQERILSAAATTSLLLRRGFSETKDVMVVGKMKVEEAAKKTADKSKSILINIERWQKGVAGSDVFGAPIEFIVQREQSLTPIPQVLMKCADYLILSGLNTEYLFKLDGDRKVIRHLVSLFNQDWNAPLPENVRPIDVAALIKCYLASLPDPLTTFSLYNEIREARSSINDMRNILRKLPNVRYVTLEFVTALLLRVSQKSTLNKMDARSLAIELAPLIIWQKGDSGEEFRNQLGYTSKEPPKTADLSSDQNAWDILSDEEDRTDASSQIPLDDGSPPDYSAIEVIQCLIEHHNTIFTDATETIWR